jgi:glutathione S-transferase
VRRRDVFDSANVLKDSILGSLSFVSQFTGSDLTPCFVSSEGGKTLYIKAGPDGTSVGDCPFAHFVRMVLHEKNLEYDVQPCTQETKPAWLIEHYEGKMPALRHRKECYTESEVIAQYLDFFFQEPELSGKKQAMADVNEVIDGFFPAVAKYLKHTPDGDDDDLELKGNLEAALQKLETHLTREDRTGPYLVGDGESLTLADCSLAPKLYHMQTGLKAFKDNAIDVGSRFPSTRAYMDAVFARQSFVDGLYPEETVVWGWSSARQSK